MNGAGSNAHQISEGTVFASINECQTSSRLCNRYEREHRDMVPSECNVTRCPWDIQAAYRQTWVDEMVSHTLEISLLVSCGVNRRIVDKIRMR